MLFKEMKLSLKEIARYLDIPERTVERWVRQGRIPAQKKGDSCIFQKSAMEKWAHTRNLSFSLPKEKAVKKMDDDLKSLQAVMKKGGLYYGIEESNYSICQLCGFDPSVLFLFSSIAFDKEAF